MWMSVRYVSFVAICVYAQQGFTIFPTGMAMVNDKIGVPQIPSKPITQRVNISVHEQATILTKILFVH